MLLFNFIQLILFLLKRKFQSYFHFDNWKGLLGDSLYTILLLIYAIVVGIMYNSATRGTSRLILNSVSLSLLFVPVLYKFFPSFSLKKAFIASQYPLNRFQKTTIDLIAFSLYKTIYLILLLFVIVFYFSAHALKFNVLWELILNWLLGVLLAESFIAAISWHNLIHLIFLIIIFAFFYLFDRLVWPINRSVFLFALDVVLVFLYYIYYPDRIMVRQKQIRVKQGIQLKSYWRIVFRLFVGNKNALTTLLFGLLMINIVFPVAFLSAQRTNEVGLFYLFNKLPFFTVFFLPTILFTYVFNNVWGFYHDVAVNYVIINSSFKEQLKLYISLIIPGTAASVIITCSILLCFGTFSWKMMVLYFIYCFLTVPIGILSSSLRYKRMAAYFDLVKLRTNVSIVSTIVLFSISTIVGAFYSSKYLVLIACCQVVIGLVLFLILIKKGKYLNKTLKNRLLSKRSF